MKQQQNQKQKSDEALDALAGLMGELKHLTRFEDVMKRVSPTFAHRVLEARRVLDRDYAEANLGPWSEKYNKRQIEKSREEGSK